MSPFVMQPTQFGEYTIERKLQGGGMGRVYLARHPRFGPVALKLIDHGSDPDSLEVLDAERRGVQLQARLCALDERVTVVHDYGDRDGFFCIAMEYVEGRDLSEVLEGGALTAERSLAVAIHLCEVLDHAHTFRAMIENREYHGIVHGDIKPRNVRVSTGGQVKVLDFGIAKALSLTRRFTQNQFGSVPYSSPERLNSGEVTVDSDLWSVAVVLYEMLTGRPYFQAESTQRLEHIIRNYRAPQPLPPGLPGPVRLVLAKALHPDLERRYRSAAEFRDDLQEALAALDGEMDDEEATRRIGLGADEATRRSGPAEDDATRRSGAVTTEEPTRRGAPRLPVPPPVPPAAVPGPMRLHQTVAAKNSLAGIPFAQRHWRALVGLGVVLLLALAVNNEYRVWQQGGALQRELDSERLTDMKAAMARYEALSRASILPAVLGGPRRALKQRLLAESDHTIGEYRERESPTVTEGDWMRSKQSLLRALELSPGDKDLLGRLRICEGHIERINAPRRGASKRWSEAVSKFEEAHALLSRSPDPYLGLARIYAYGPDDVKDFDKLNDALEEAERRGYRLGRREKAQLAQGRQDRASKLRLEALRAQGTPAEKEYLERASKDLEEAEDLYREIVPFGNAGTSLQAVTKTRESVEARLRELDEGGLF